MEGSGFNEAFTLEDWIPLPARGRVLRIRHEGNETRAEPQDQVSGDGDGEWMVGEVMDG